MSSKRSSSRSSSRRSARKSPSLQPTRSILPSPAPSYSIMPSISSLLNRIGSSVITSEARPKPAPIGPDPSSTSVRDLLQHNTDRVMQARSRLEVGRRQVFYFLTVPGLIRILEVFFAVMHVGVFGYHCTYYENVVKIMIPPFFLSHIREQYFMLSNYHSLLGCMVIILAGIFNSVSNTALLSSLYPLIFDFLQCLTIASSSVALLQFYGRYSLEIKKIMPIGASYKQAMAITGLILACLHITSLVYDWVVFIKRIKILRMERDALRREDEATAR